MAKILKSSLPYKGPMTENLVEFIRNGLRKNSHETIFIDSKTGISWNGKEIEAAVTSISRYLKNDLGLQKGDVCSLYGCESDVFVLMILSVISAGGVSNFLTEKSSGREVHDVACVLGSKFMFSSSDLLNNIEPEIVDLKDKIQIISVDEVCDKLNCGSQSLKKFFLKENLDFSLNLDCLIDEIKINAEQDFAVIQFSSGTTGKPKPIPRTHKNMCHLVASVDHEQLMDLKPGVVIAGSLPITHRPGIWALLAAINNGNTFVIWSKLSDVEDALATIERYKVTSFSSSLPFLSMLGNSGVQLKDKYDTSSLKHIFTSGAKIVNPDLPKSIIKEFNLKSLRQCFGMTEAGWVFLVESSLAEGKYLSVGHIVPGSEAIVIDRESLDKLGPNEKGELAIRGPQVFPGYITSEPGVFNRADFTESGWFRSGDQCYYDENEFVFIEGRYKEVMMFENNALYFPNEIEAIITEHPSVECACVVKVDQVRVDYPYDIAKAFITLKHNQVLTQDELIGFVQSRAPAMILSGGVQILQQFPRLQNGKIDKQALRN